MKQLKDCKCRELRCKDCPLRIFGCTIVDHSEYYVIEDEESWNLEMTLDEVLEERILTVKPTVTENKLMKLIFDSAVACAKIALLNYIDEEELNHD